MNTFVQEQSITYLGMSVTSDAIETELNDHDYVTLNSPEGLANLLSRLGDPGHSLRIICEQAGGAETALVRALWAAGFTVGVVPTKAVCAAEGLHDATEISPSILARFGCANAEKISFLTGNLGPKTSVTRVSFAAIPQVSRNARRVSTWVGIVRWFRKLRNQRSR